MAHNRPDRDPLTDGIERRAARQDPLEAGIERRAARQDPRELRKERRGLSDQDQTDSVIPADPPDPLPADAVPTDTPTGLGDPSRTPFSNFETTEDILARILGQDSLLMQRAAAQGKQFANRRGLLNSSIAAQASQAALIDRAVPIASQSSDQGFRRGLQESEQVFEGSESQKERAQKLDIVKREEALQREKILSDETIAASDRALRKTIASETVSANDRRGAEATLSNAYRDYESSLASIMSNTELSSDTRNLLLTNAKNMLTAKIDYASELYGAVFDWPDNPFAGSGVISTTAPVTTNLAVFQSSRGDEGGGDRDGGAGDVGGGRSGGGGGVGGGPGSEADGGPT